MHKIIKYFEGIYYSIRSDIIKNKISKFEKEINQLDGECISIACAKRVSREYHIENLENKLGNYHIKNAS